MLCRIPLQRLGGASAEERRVPRSSRSRSAQRAPARSPGERASRAASPRSSRAAAPSGADEIAPSLPCQLSKEGSGGG